MSKSDVQMKWVEILREMVGNGYDTGGIMKCLPFILKFMPIASRDMLTISQYDTDFLSPRVTNFVSDTTISSVTLAQILEAILHSLLSLYLYSNNS